MKQETEGNPKGDPLMATLFRNAVIDAMPQAVKSRLKDVVGLNFYKSRRQRPA